MKPKYNVGDKVQLNWEHNNEVVTVTEIDIREKWDGSKLLTEPIIAFKKKEDNEQPIQVAHRIFKTLVEARKKLNGQD